ncbi:MAG: formylglycine-generating enzyme family protein [Bacteroidales bacterium]|nr:formylglycine-generating enzyme family protein [Bacteroidales bacterium]
MKKILLTLMMVAVLFIAPSQAQNQRLKLAVYATGNIDALLKNIAQNNASTELVNCGRYQMIERSAEFLRFVSEEQNYQRSGAVDDNQIAELGKQYGADCVCVVDITHVDSYLYVATRMIDVTLSTSQRAGDAENTNYSSPVDLRKTVTAAVKKMEGINTGNNNGNGNSYYGNAAPGQNYTENAFGINMKMVYVQGGSYNMGCTGEQGGDCDADEKTVRYVTVSDFYIGQFEITQAQWQAVMGTSVYQQQSKAGGSSTYGTGNDYPMYYVSWEEAKEFCRRLSQQTGKTYRLPTEAEWEYAARGGKKTQNTKYAGGYSLDYVGWYTSNSGGKTHAVGTKNANELGIYDMSGNVWEWCEDWYGDYRSYDTDNPTGASSGSDRVLRGGSWYGSATGCRVAARNGGSPGCRADDLGFRVVCLP